MQELSEIVSKTVRELQNGKISKEEFILISNQHQFEKYHNTRLNKNIINIVAGTLTSLSPLEKSIFEFYLSKGISPDLSDDIKNRTALFSCSYRDDIVRLLVEYGVNLNHTDLGGNTFMMYGTNFKVFNFAVQNGYDLSIVNNNGGNILTSLFKNRYNSALEILEQIQILSFIIDEHIFDLNSYNERGLSVIQLAITLGNLPLKALELLLKYGADPHLKTITETSFRLWSDEDTVLPIGISTLDIFKKQKETLISENKQGLVADGDYFKEGLDYFEKAIRILESK